MKEYATDKIRNLVLIGHGGTGKTSLAEAALFSQGYPVSATTLEPCQLIFVERERFLAQLSSSPELAIRLLVGLSAKLHHLVGRIEDLTLRDARGRLCNYLGAFIPESVTTGPTEVRLPVSQVALAQLLGITEETLSRSIRSLRKDGLLEADSRGNFIVEDADRFRRAYSI